MVNPLESFNKEIDKEIIQPLRNVTIGRKLVYVTAPKGFGISSVDWGKIADMSAGKVSYGFTSGNEDVISVNLTNSKVPVYWKDYRVDRRAYESWKRSNVDLDAASALSAGYMAMSAEDAAIIDGVKNDNSTYDIDGLFQGAGNTCDEDAGSADFGEYGNAKDTIAAAKKLMADDGVPAYTLPLNLVLASTQYSQLESSESDSGVEEMPKVERMLNGGSIYSVPETLLAAGTGLLLPTPAVGRSYVDFFLTKDFGTEHGFDSEHPDTSDLNGRVYSAGVLRIKNDVGICKIEDI